MLYSYLGLIPIAAALLALWYGSGPERVVLQIWLAVTFVDVVYHVTIGSIRYQGLNVGHVVLDGIATVGFFWVALRANRVWPLWVAALQMQPLIVHLSMALHLPGQRTAYWLMMAAPSDFEILIVLIGTIAHVHRKRLVGPYRDWRLT